jgi:hypothetical protein
MCTCASCENTDSFRDKTFAEWPRGNPAGRKAASEYEALVAYARQWGRGYAGVMHEPPIGIKARAYSPSREDPHAGYKFPGTWDKVQRREIPMPDTGSDYAAQFARLNHLLMDERNSPAFAGLSRPAQLGKAAQHFPARDRPRQAKMQALHRGARSAKRTNMNEPKPKVKRPRGRPSLGIAKRIMVSLDAASIERARALGGTISAGIRKALKDQPLT